METLFLFHAVVKKSMADTKLSQFLFSEIRKVFLSNTLIK